MGNKKHATCFVTLLQNKLKSNVVRFTTHIKPVLQQIRLLTGLNLVVKWQHRHSTHFTATFQTKLRVFCCTFSWTFKHHIYIKWQMHICITWPSFPLTCHLLFIIFTHKLPVVVSQIFFIQKNNVLNCFYVHIFFFGEILNLNLTFAIYAKHEHSLVICNISKKNNTTLTKHLC